MRLIDLLDAEQLRLASQVLLRLAVLPYEELWGFPVVLPRALASLEEIEKRASIIVTPLDTRKEPARTDLRPPYSGLRASQTPSMGVLRAWGESVELLWQVSMACDANEQWDHFTYRLLVWRSIAGPHRTPMGEWARKEVIKCMGS